MSTENNKEFYQLLNEIVELQTFDLSLSDGSSVKCKQLTTSQLKDLIKSIVDSPLTQAEFNTTASKIFKNSIEDSAEQLKDLNIVDRLLFLLETRIQSISPTMKVVHNNKEIQVDFKTVKNNLQESVAKNLNLFAEQTIVEPKMEITVGVPSISTETQLNEELYKNVSVDVQDADQLRKLLGEAFVNEIAKTVKTIKIQDKILDFSTTTFKSRLKTVESLPAGIVQKVIEYIENYKKVIDEVLLIEGYVLPIDGSLFSIRQ